MERGVSGPRVGLLHTVPALVPVFDRAVGSLVPDVRIMHAVDADLLATAIREGVTAEVEHRVAGHVRHLVEDGAEAVLVTCSSIGEAVEAAAAGSAVPVLRVDGPMAAEAVEIAGRGRGRIAVLATLQATLGPTGRLIERAARAAAGRAEVFATVVAGAAAARDAGDVEEHDRLVAAAVQHADADVVVLAQASMAAAAARADVAVPVLTSPEGGTAALAAAIGRRPAQISSTSAIP